MRRALWTLPPACAVLAYAMTLSWVKAHAGSGVVGQGDGASPALAVRSSSTHDRTGREKPPANPGELRTRLQQALDAERAALGTRTPQELREIILRLKKDRAAPLADRQWQDEETSPYLIAAATALGRQQHGEALAWVMTHAPEQRNDVLEGWAQTQPDEAFDAIVHSDRREPCRKTTLMALLQGFGDRDPALLKQRGARVKWELFRSEWETMPFTGPSRNFDFSGQAGPWMKSGLAGEMEALGLSSPRLWPLWTQESPDEALASWLKGEGMKAERQESVLRSMLGHQMDNPEIRAALDRLPPSDRARIMAILQPEEDDPGSPATPEPAAEETSGDDEDSR